MPANLTRQWLIEHDKPVIPADTPVRVMQFGGGAFLRAFADYIFKRMNDAGQFQGTVRVVQATRHGTVEKMKRRDYLYCVLLRGMEGGKVVDEPYFVDVIRDGVDPYAEWRRFLAAAAEPELRYVVSNTTEAGIVYTATARPDECPESFPAKVAAMLAHRYDALGGSVDKGLVFLPCELIEKNGDALKETIARHLHDWGLTESVGAWMEKSCRFYNSLVDRIVSGFPHGEAEAIWEKLGCRDELLDVGECFLLWVMEGDPRLKDELPFEQTGLDIIVTDNLAPYRDRKVRLLNGAHTANVLAAYLAGVDTVGEMMDDKLLGGNLRAMVKEEILPGVKLPDTEKNTYAEAVFERFQNPFVRHELLSISLNSASKWKVRVLPSLKDYVAERGKLPKRMTFSMAALIAFYRGVWRGDVYQGDRNGNAYPIRDDKPVLDFFSDAWNRYADDPETLASRTLANSSFWGEDLTAIPGFVDAVAKALAAIDAVGVRKAITERL